MLKKPVHLLSTIAVLAILLTSCGGGTQEQGGIPENAALRITGNVAAEIG